MTTGPTAPATDATSGLATALTTVDGEAAQRLTALGLVYQARQSRLSRTAASVAAQQGANSPQAAAAEAAVAAAKTTAARLAVIQQQVTTEAPAVPATGWALHGRVYTAQLEPAADHCVFLVDAQNAYFAPSGFAYTDSTGYFLITYPGAATGTSDSAAEPQLDAAAEPPTLSVEVTNPKAKPVYLGTTPITQTSDTATYLAITLPPGDQLIGNPPRAVRTTASPRRPTAAKRRKSTPDG
jgi:hypothetical protein